MEQLEGELPVVRTSPQFIPDLQARYPYRDLVRLLNTDDPSTSIDTVVLVSCPDGSYDKDDNFRRGYKSFLEAWNRASHRRTIRCFRILQEFGSDLPISSILDGPRHILHLDLSNCFLKRTEYRALTNYLQVDRSLTRLDLLARWPPTVSIDNLDLQLWDDLRDALTVNSTLKTLKVRFHGGDRVYLPLNFHGLVKALKQNTGITTLTVRVYDEMDFFRPVEECLSLYNETLQRVTIVVSRARANGGDNYLPIPSNVQLLLHTNAEIRALRDRVNNGLPYKVHNKQVIDRMLRLKSQSDTSDECRSLDMIYLLLRGDVARYLVETSSTGENTIRNIVCGPFNDTTTQDGTSLGIPLTAVAEDNKQENNEDVEEEEEDSKPKAKKQKMGFP